MNRLSLCHHSRWEILCIKAFIYHYHLITNYFDTKEVENIERIIKSHRWSLNCQFDMVQTNGGWWTILSNIGPQPHERPSLPKQRLNPVEQRPEHQHQVTADSRLFKMVGAVLSGLPVLSSPFCLCLPPSFNIWTGHWSLTRRFSGRCLGFVSAGQISFS